MCFKPKVKTPQASSAGLTLPEKIYQPANPGVQYGGQGDTASGMDEATVSTEPTDTGDTATSATIVTPTSAPTFQSNTSVSTEETSPTKQSQQKKVVRKTVY